MNNRRVGTQYEERACEYLKSLGYEIIERNFRGKRGEIDIIAKDGDTLVFVEVKYRETNEKGYPEEAITRAKRATIRGVARYYLLEKGLGEYVPCRFDAICYYYEYDYKHYINAFGGM